LREPGRISYNKRDRHRICPSYGHK
jgi:hypothetical protein